MQRVTEASVKVEGEIVGRIGPGLLLLAAVGRGENEKSVRRMAEKCLALRVFPDEKGHFEHSVVDREGEILAVSQFTLLGDCRKGRRPSLSRAAAPDLAEPLFRLFVEELRRGGRNVETGVFGAMMQVHLVNDGPVTFLLET